LNALNSERRSLFGIRLTAARTDLRLGELLALVWENVDLHSGIIFVNHAMSRGKIGTTKSGKSREVHMSQHLADTLRALHLRRREETLAKGLSDIPEFVFLTSAGHPVGCGPTYDTTLSGVL